MICKLRPQTIKCRVVEISKGTYSKIIVEDLSVHEYLMVTVFPNWQSPLPLKNQKGYMEFEFAEAGSKYFNKDTKQYDYYLNTYFVFKTFIPETPKNQEDVTL